MRIRGLTGIGRRTQIDEETALGVDDEGMHRMVASERQTGEDHFGPGFRATAVDGSG